WTTPGDSLTWTFQVTKPGEFDISGITSEQKYGQNWEGGHKVALTLAGNTVRGVIANEGKVENPNNPYWPYVLSRLGTIKVPKAGTYQLVFNAESIEAPKNFGLTLVSVTL